MNNIKKAFALVLALMVFCCVFTACKPDNIDTTQPSENVTEQPTTTAEPVTTQGEVASIKLLSSYAPVRAFDSDGNEVSVQFVYGSSYRDYGGSLCFKEDGTFTTFIGAFGNVNNESGKYRIVSDTEIEMVYNNDTIETAVVLSVDTEGNVAELRMPHRNFDVVFAQE